MSKTFIFILFFTIASNCSNSAFSENYNYINDYIIKEQYQIAINSIINEAKKNGYNNELKKLTTRIEKLIELDKKVYQKVDIYGNEYLKWYEREKQNISKHRLMVGAFLTAFIANQVADYFNKSSEIKHYHQADAIVSNVYADKNSIGTVNSVCFYFNNMHELDINYRLIVQHKEKKYLKTDTKGLFGDSCINGESLGGRYSFTYITDNKVRTGEFNISGSHKFIDVDLSNFFLDNDISINERN